MSIIIGAIVVGLIVGAIAFTIQDGLGAWADYVLWRN